MMCDQRGLYSHRTDVCRKQALHDLLIESDQVLKHLEKSRPDTQIWICSTACFRGGSCGVQ